MGRSERILWTELDSNESYSFPFISFKISHLNTF